LDGGVALGEIPIIGKPEMEGNDMPTLPLEEMSVTEKLQVMEELWSDLCCNQDQIPVPQWQVHPHACGEHRIAVVHENGTHFRFC
jgi:hypothetical protein